LKFSLTQKNPTTPMNKKYQKELAGLCIPLPLNVKGGDVNAGGELEEDDGQLGEFPGRDVMAAVCVCLEYGVVAGILL
jgi:hypothetical protein